MNIIQAKHYKTLLMTYMLKDSVELQQIYMESFEKGHIFGLEEVELLFINRLTTNSRCSILGPS